MPPKSAPPAAFGWDQARIHRVQLLRGEGMLININDRCSVLFSGFVIPFCKIGRIPVNGDLFEHLHDGSRDRLHALP
jgi:hypothetical protein